MRSSLWAASSGAAKSVNKYLFIDGAFFEGICQRIGARIEPEFQLFERLDSQKLLSSYSRAFYYNSLPDRSMSLSSEEHDERVKNKQSLFNRLNMIPKLRVHTGESRYRKKRGVEQKGIDVLLAIEVYQHAIQGNMDIATIITSDLDFYPLFEALVQTRVRTELFYDPDGVNIDLVHAADTAYAINASVFLRWMDNEFCKNHVVNITSGSNIRNEALLNNTILRKGTYLGRTFYLAKNQKSGRWIAYMEGDDHYTSSTDEYILLSHFRNHPDSIVIFDEE